MFRFWSADARGSDRTAESGIPSPDYDNISPTRSESTATPVYQPFSDRPLKRRRSNASEDVSHHYVNDGPSPAKRIKPEAVSLLSPQSTFADGDDIQGPLDVSMARPDLEDAREAIQFQFGLEILLKHDELRLINQELAKCQVALEQLRRCHLIPYPVSCPTPEQMLRISSGTGPAVQMQPGEPVPKWAPPFGVVDGPYARHYAKWLIPDPKFDGIQPEPQGVPATGRKVSGAEGRTTRNSITENNAAKSRPARGSAGQKLQALSSGYAQPKDTQGPCTLKRSDGQIVKLICVDCQRWNFSSTQGFINHCRIAHKRDYKSHEEAAVHAGHPIEIDEAGAIVGDDKPAPATTPVSGLVHPFARAEPITEGQAYAALISRINSSLELYHAGQLPNVTNIPGTGLARPSTTASPAPFTSASTTPYLSQLLQNRKFSGNLSSQVAEAKIKMDLDDVFTPGEDSDEPDLPAPMHGASNTRPPAPGVRTPAPAVMRVPARTVVSPVPLPSIPSIPRPTSSKARAPHLSFKPVKVPAMPERDDECSDMYDEDEMGVDLSPNTIASHTAPSLVSDDGEYDDWDDGSSSEASESMETESVSDVAEINIDEDNDETPRPIRHHRNNSATTVKLRKDEAKHVTFVTPLTGNPPQKAKGRPRKQTS